MNFCRPGFIDENDMSYLEIIRSFTTSTLNWKKTSDFIANDSWLWNTHGANEMTSLNDIFFKYLCCKSQLHAIGKIKILKRQLTNPTLLRVAPNCIIESQGGWKVKFLHLQKTKHWNTVQKVNKIRVSYGKNWLI